jgi:tetratricopeptide (TPR) repeat protein
MNRYTSLAVALGLFGAVAVARTLRSAADADPMHRLEHAEAGRAFAPRLSIPTKYRRCTPLRARRDEIVPRAACGEAEDAALDANAFPSIVESTDPDSLEAAALTKVIWGDGTEGLLGDAISRLEKAIRLTDRPVPVRLLVDLSAAHLVRAEQTQNSSDLVRGLDNALQALEREPKNEAALFDAALALESLALDGEAVKAWNRYLAVDSTSVWAREARQRRDNLLKPPPPLRKPRPNAPAAEVEAFAAQHPQEARLLGWDTELGDWGAAVLHGDTAAAASHLDLAERLGNALVRHGGDASLVEAVHAIHAASSNPAATRTLARAHRAYTVGQGLFRVKDYKASEDSLRWVVRSGAASSVLVDWAVVSLAGAGVYLEPGGGDAVIRALVARVDSVRYPAMAARLRWMWGTKMTRGAHYQEARGQYEAAAHLYERLGETEFEGAVLAFAGEAAYKHGDAPVAYSETHRALVKLRHYRSSVWLHNPLMTLATSATLEGMERAAAPIQDEDVVVALRNDVPEIPLEALLGRVRISTMAGDSAAARRDLGAAVAFFRKIEPGGHDWLNAELQFTRALVTPRADSGSVAGLVARGIHASGRRAAGIRESPRCHGRSG